jgi:SagB-type dehydrogenase family enzyme
MPEGNKFVAQTNESQPPLLLLNSNVAWALSMLPSTFDEKGVLELWGRHIGSAELADELWSIAVDEGLIIPACEVGDRARLWGRFGWDEALSYQEATRDFPFVQMHLDDAFEQDDSRMQAYVEQSPPPSIYLEIESAFQIKLRKLQVGESADAIIGAMTEDERRGLDGLGLFFDICFGERTSRPFNIQGEFLRKSIPSGGARHTTEVFFCSLPGAPIPEGVYHYNVQNHRLDACSEGDVTAELDHACFDLFAKYQRPPFGVLIFTSLWERAMWRYRDARSWRAPLIDIGHALMVYRTLAASFGYGYYTYQKFRDTELSELIQQDRLRLTPLFVGTLV